MLQNEFQEIEKSIHSIFTHYLTWFTFFSGVNLAGYGWFAQLLAERKAVAKWLILIICIYFVFQQILALAASQQLISYLKSSQKRMILLLTELDQDSGYQIKAQIASPVELYIRVTKLIMSTFPSMIFLWVAFTIFAFLK
jgi:hypothetical protein